MVGILLFGAAASSRGWEVCLSYPQTRVGVEVAEIVKEKIAEANLDIVPSDRPCPPGAYRLDLKTVQDNVLIEGEKEEIVLKACLVTPLNVETCSRVARPKGHPKGRRGLIDLAISMAFSGSLLALPETPVGYYSVLSCTDALRFKIKLAQYAVTPRDLPAFYFRVAFPKTTLSEAWLDAERFYVYSSRQIPLSTPTTPFEVTFAHGNPLDEDGLKDFCRQGGYAKGKGALLVPYLLPGIFDPERIDVLGRGFSAGLATDMKSKVPERGAP